MTNEESCINELKELFINVEDGMAIYKLYDRQVIKIDIEEANYVPSIIVRELIEQAYRTAYHIGVKTTQDGLKAYLGL